MVSHVLAIQRRAFAGAWPNELGAITNALLKLRRRHGWQVVRLDVEDEELEPRDVYATALVYGVRATLDNLGEPAAAVLSCSPRPWVVPAGGDVTQEAVHGARDWEAETLVVVGPNADASVLDRALLDGYIQSGCAATTLSVETLNLVVGAFSDVRLGQQDYGGLPPD